MLNHSSASPSPAFHPSGAPGSRTPNALLDASCSKAKKSQEQLNALKDSFVVNQFPDNDEVDRLISLTGLTVREVRKWFSDRRYHFRNLKGSRTSAGAGGGGGDGGGKKGGTPGAGGAAGGGGGGGDLDVPDGNAGARTPQQASAPLSPSPSQTPTSPTTPSRRTPRPPSPDFTAIRYKEREPHQVRDVVCVALQNRKNRNVKRLYNKQIILCIYLFIYLFIYS